MARSKQGWVVRGEDGLELGEFRAALVEEVNARWVQSIGFHRGIGYREEEKNPTMRKGCQDEHGWQYEVNAVAVGPLEKQCGGFHFSSDVAMTVG